MDAETIQTRQTRARHRHELRTLTYVTLDQANGGVVRNLTSEGIGLQVVAAVRPKQQLRVRFELRHPRLRVEARGEVVWATFSGQCGIRFLDMAPRMRRQVQEWIFGDLLEGASLHAGQVQSIFNEATASVISVDRTATIAEAEKDDGLMVSSAARNVIELPPPPEPVLVHRNSEIAASELDWLSQPLSGQGLAWTINGLVVFAGLLLFTLIFLSVTRQTPSWPMVASAGLFVVAMYWVFFQMFGGSSLGARLARLMGSDEEEQEELDARFR